VAGHTGSGRIRCGSARSGQACTKGSDWPGARDPSDPLQPHRCVGWRAKENPTGFWVRRQVFDAFAPKGRRSIKGSPAVRCGDGRLARDMASKRRPRAATGSKKGGALDPQGAPTARRR
jgi:hypothetical protein